MTTKDTPPKVVTLAQSDALNALALEISREQMELIKRTVAADATPEELALFLFDCKRQGVHPLDNLLHFNVRTNRRTGKRRYTPITAIDFMRMRAHETGECAGIEDPVLGETNGDRFARVTVYRFVQNQKCPFTATAWWSEYDPGDGPEGFMYQKMPKGMLGKCAEALALRKAFPKQLHGIYERAEMAQAGREDEGRSHGEAVSGAGERTPERTRSGVVTQAELGNSSRSPRGGGPDSDKVETEITVPSETLFESPLSEETLDTKIAKHTEARITLMMHKFDLGEGEWQKLDLASKAMLAKHLDTGKK